MSCKVSKFAICKSLKVDNASKRCKLNKWTREYWKGYIYIIDNIYNSSWWSSNVEDFFFWDNTKDYTSMCILEQHSHYDFTCLMNGLYIIVFGFFSLLAIATCLDWLLKALKICHNPITLVEQMQATNVTVHSLKQQ